eukprot:Sdes_comp10182_c0_seq1m1797
MVRKEGAQIWNPWEGFLQLRVHLLKINSSKDSQQSTENESSIELGHQNSGHERFEPQRNFNFLFTHTVNGFLVRETFVFFWLGKRKSLWVEHKINTKLGAKTFTVKNHTNTRQMQRTKLMQG